MVYKAVMENNEQFCETETKPKQNAQEYQSADLLAPFMLANKPCSVSVFGAVQSQLRF